MQHTLEQLRSGALAGTRRLNLCAGLDEFPREIFDLAETLEVLELSGNALSALPDDLPRLRKLRILFASSNRFTELPAVLGRCEQLEMVGFKANRIRTVPAASLPQRLRWLILTDNEVESLPAEIGRCTRLQKLALAGNRLRELPAAMSACTSLELLRISANRMHALPEWLLQLPRLSWLAFAGNPFCEASEAAALAQAPLASAPWSSLALQDLLGEGASGVIHRAKRADGAEVAVKVFRGEVTSDGWPHSEMAAAMHAGAHAHLIPVLGRLTEHPAQAQGLLMERVAPEFHSLAGPPSLDSCTRDVYGAGVRFDRESLVRLARGIVSAVSHLHRRGINHGDLYAHNILHTRDGRSFLGDFGAASFFDARQAPLARALQMLEVRAFGYLLEELIERCETPIQDSPLILLRNRCLSERPAERPTLDEIEQVLHQCADA